MKPATVKTLVKVPFVTLLICFAFITLAGNAQISITSLPARYSNNFNSYNPTTASKVPSTINESGTGTGLVSAKTGWSYANAPGNFWGRSSGNGSNGGLYGFFIGTGTEISLGALRSGLAPNEISYTLSFTNNSGSTITALTIAWDYEQWRYANTSGWNVTGTGALSSNATLNGKDFTGTATGTNGTPTTTSVAPFTLTGLSIANGASFGFSWITTDVTGSDNGIAIDNFSLATTDNYFWNGGSIAVSPADGGSGVWTTTNAWRQPTNTGLQATWADGNIANLAGTEGTITIPADIAPSNTIIATDGYKLTTSASSTLSGSIDLGGFTLNTAPALGQTLTLPGIVSSAGGLSQNGAGTTVLTGANTYTGNTTVSAGTLQLSRSGSGTLPATNNITVIGGKLRVSSNQTLHNLTVTTGGEVVVDNGVTLTITGIFARSGTSITGSGTIAMAPSAVLQTNPGAWPENTCTYISNASATLVLKNSSEPYNLRVRKTAMMCN